MSKKVNIEKILVPDCNEIVMIDGITNTKILDAELDELEVRFNDDDCAEINTEKLQYITLSIDNLYDLIDLIEAARNEYDKLDD